jgi:hypothetical protein
MALDLFEESRSADFSLGEFRPARVGFPEFADLSF